MSGGSGSGRNLRATSGMPPDGSPTPTSPWTLLPNLGAEEGEDWPRHAGHPPVAATAALWRHLFPAAHAVIGPVHADAETWPAALGERPAGAAFRWLDDRPGTHAWLGDADARARATEAGVPWPAPEPDTTLAVHDKAFAVRTAAEQGFEPRALRGLVRVLDADLLGDARRTRDALATALADWPAWTGGRFVLKPRLGSSGRGRVAGRRDALDDETLCGALPRLAARRGAILEPWLSRAADLSVALHVAPPDEAAGGTGVTLLGSLEQVVSPAGVPLGHAGEIDARGRVTSAHRYDEAVREAAVALALAARAAGYFGPCGVDALAFRVPEAASPATEGTRDAPAARTHLRPVVELNARFTLGVVAIGMLRRLLGRLRAEHGLAPDRRLGFLFALAPPADAPDWATAARTAGGDAGSFALDPDDSGRGPGVLVVRDRAALDPLLAAARA